MKKTTKMFPLTRTSLVRSLFASTVALLLAGLSFSAQAVLGADLSAVGSAVSSSGANPYVGLIDRGDGSFALIFTNAQETTFTFNSPWTVKEFLVVGGGGAGGGNGGGGGGGGGVIYYTEDLIAADNLPTAYANGDSITITVGAGGTGGFKLRGTAGGYSELNLGDKTYAAFGGAGGAQWESSAADRVPNPGVYAEESNTGCGAGRYVAVDATIGNSSTMPNRPGYYGTSGGAGFSQKACGGGGGAGEVGGDASSATLGGKGGDGLYCPILMMGGVADYYAAGGGGSDENQGEKDVTKHARGGLGGGGNASLQGDGRASPQEATQPTEGTHATGYGCGGGGGIGGGSGKNTGGNGSAGIVVLLIEPMSFKLSAVVDVTYDSETSGSAKITAKPANLGDDGATKADVYFAFGESADNLGPYELLSGDGLVDGGECSKTLAGLVYDKEYFYSFRATNDAATPASEEFVGSFMIPSPAPLSINYASVAGAYRRGDVIIDLCVGDLADSAVLSVAYGTSATSLITTKVIDDAAKSGVVKFSIEGLTDSTSGPKTYYCSISAENELGAVTTSTFSFIVPKLATGPRLWVGGGIPQADGSLRWDDHLNWEAGIVPKDGEAVHFPDKTTATIEMPARAIASNGEFAISNKCNIVLKKSSEVDTDLEYKFNGKVTLPETSTLTLSGSHVWFSNGTASNYKFAGDLTVTDGAYFQLSAGLVISNNLITVEKKSKFGLPKNGITLAGETKFILDDSELLSEGGSKTVTFRNTATLEFKGKAPYANICIQGANADGHSPHLIFNVPEGGYDRIPLVNGSTTTMPSSRKIYCEVDRLSPVFSSGVGKVVPLIVSTNAVTYSTSQTNMELVEIAIPEGSEAAWVYRTTVSSDEDLKDASYVSRDGWSDAVPRSSVVKSTVKTLGVYIKGSGEERLTLSGGTVTPEKTSASVSVKVARVGEGADSAEVSVVWGTSADALVNTNALAESAVAGEICNGTIDGLSVDTTYFYAFTATNGLGQTVTTTPATFTTLAAEVLTLADASATAQKTSAEVSVTVSLLGEGATGADVYFAYGPSAGELGTPALVKSGATANETVTAQVSGLMPETTYEYAFSATNNAMPAQFADLAGSFTTLSPDRITLSGLTALAGSNGKSFTATVSVGSLGSGTDPKVSLQYRETGTESWLVAGTNDLAAVGDSEFSVTLAETVADETTFDLRAIASMTEAGVVYATTSTVSQVTLVPPDVPFGADPVIRNGEASVDGGTVRVPYSVEWAGEGKETCSVELAYGLAADDLCFTNEVGSALFGAGTAELANLAPGRTYYMQFTADNGETTGSTAVFSVTIPADGVFPTTFAEGQAVIAGLGAHFLIVDGTAATYSGTFANYVEGTTVMLHYSADDGETWTTDTPTVTDAGFSGSLENLASGTYICYLTAELDGSTVDRTPEQTIATNGGTTLNSAITVGTAINAITVKFTVSKLGSGSSRTGLVMANVDGTWTEVYSQTLTGSATYTFDGSTIFDFATAYDLKVVARDTSADGTVVWENSTATAQFKAVDTTARTYTWTGAGDNDLWNNPANWSVDPTATSASGYPATPTANVVFPVDVVATVLVSRAEVAGIVNVTNVEYLCLQGVSSEVSSITCKNIQLGNAHMDKETPGSGGIFELVVDGLTLAETEFVMPSSGQWKGKNHHHLGVGASLTLTNGAEFYSLGNWTPYDDDTTIRVEKGSVFHVNTYESADPWYRFYLGGHDNQLVIDDSTMEVEGMLRLNDINAMGDQTPNYIIFEGTNPVLRVSKDIYSGGTGKIPTVIEFRLPPDGYSESPIQIGGTAPFPDKKGGASTPVTLSIVPPDPADPSCMKLGEASLISCQAGINPDLISLSAETEKICRLIFTGDNGKGSPTTLRVVRRGSTYFLQ